MGNGETPVVTAKMAEALLLIAEVGPLAESNVTSRDRLTIYHATAKRLAMAWLIMHIATDEHYRFVWGLTPAGEAFVEARQ